ncbi:AT-hook motif nuclear-localized protein 11 isoform X2 [Physcomitrium patens]|uniref:AT-hook motif nuclear-localized protein n=3 Tax=Physcomitrium patens TaxID=3218 RepID=A0A7I4EFF0_PHYPA|nr:AT-hook motif nuclear-localized protein 7-like isoform X2 [Physcomitrium patens]XP_024383308.1 AT-hook motif nuclear-localized protein 7-like isoform X2 [Physcomitrium patens]|eukprot:XP_024383307.1 AT-hook motif nuclear-localized protein 7-like isoform X2 [Physcomitrella patens]
MQDSAEFLQHTGGGGMSRSPHGGGMAGVPSQGLHTPIAIRPPPPPSPGITPSQGGTPGISSAVPNSSPSGPLPIMAVAPPSSAGMSMAMVGPIAGDESRSGSAAATATGPEQSLKRKRGRPRKFSTGESSPIPSGAYPVFPALMPGSSSPYTPSEKRGRGRSQFSGKNQQLAALGVVLAGTGQGFTPHILTVNTGEDVATKIMQFAQHGPRAMCVLSANGAISNVTLRQQSSSGGTVTYEGRYEILSLSGSYLPTDLGGGARQRTGGLSVSLAGIDGGVIGGGVAGMLTAASPIQVVVGSFLSDTFRNKPRPDSPFSAALGRSPGVGSPLGSFSGTPRPTPPRPEPKPSPASGPQQASPDTPTGQSSVQRPQAMSIFQPTTWQFPLVPGDGRKTDINISLPDGFS